VDHGVSQSGKPAQASPAIQVTDDLGDAQGGKPGVPFAHQRIDAPAADNLGEGAAQDVTASDNQ
jgi:hypothetical protein